MSDKNETFSVGQKVVYPSQGVGKVIEIFDKEFKGKMTSYYKIYLDVTDMKVMIPVEKAKELGIRPIVSAEEAQKAIDLLAQSFEPITSDWKLRYQMNLDLLKKGSITDIATIVRCLYHRSKVKELPILERKLYDSARKLLEDEISYAMEKDPKDIEALLHEKLEPLGAEKTIKQISEDDFGDEDEDEDEFGDGEYNDVKDSDDDDDEEKDDSSDSDDDMDDDD